MAGGAADEDRAERAEITATFGHAAEIDAATAFRLGRYRDLLLQWNQRFNLTAVTEPVAVDRRLVGDALRLLPLLDAFVETVGPDATAPRLIDVGTGAGLPGLVLKIARPRLRVTLLDATGKKVSFLNEVIAVLGLTEALAIHGRAEDLGRDAIHRGRYDVVTARAVSALPTLAELTLPFLRVGGRAFFPKGMDIAEEITEGTRASRILGGRVVTATTLEPVHDAPMTQVVVIDKISDTPFRFPRRSGLPAKEPLGRVTA